MEKNAGFTQETILKSIRPARILYAGLGVKQTCCKTRLHHSKAGYATAKKHACLPACHPQAGSSELGWQGRSWVGQRLGRGRQIGAEGRQREGGHMGRPREGDTDRMCHLCQILSPSPSPVSLAWANRSCATDFIWGCWS